MTWLRLKGHDAGAMAIAIEGTRRPLACMHGRGNRSYATPPTSPISPILPMVASSPTVFPVARLHGPKGSFFPAAVDGALSPCTHIGTAGLAHARASLHNGHAPGRHCIMAPPPRASNLHRPCCCRCCHHYHYHYHYCYRQPPLDRATSTPDESE